MGEQRLKAMGGQRLKDEKSGEERWGRDATVWRLVLDWLLLRLLTMMMMMMMMMMVLISEEAKESKMPQNHRLQHWNRGQRLHRSAMTCPRVHGMKGTGLM